MIRSNRHVHLVVPYDDEVDHRSIVEVLQPTRLFGSDYIGKGSFTGDDLPLPFVYHDRSHGRSLSSLRRRVFESELSRGATQAWPKFDLDRLNMPVDQSEYPVGF